MSTPTGLYQVGPEGSKIQIAEREATRIFEIPEGLYTVKDVVNLLNLQAGWKKFFVGSDSKIGYRREPMPERLRMREA